MKHKTPALVILTPGFASSATDSTCLPAQQQLMLSLKNQFPDISFLLLAFQYPFTADVYSWNGLEVIPFNGRNRGKFYRMWLWGKVWKRLQKIKQQYELLGLFSFWYGECAMIGNWFSKRNGVPHFTWLLGQDARAHNKYVGWLHPGPDELVAVSDFVAAEFERNYRIRPARIIPTGINPDLFTEVGSERDIDILGVGSLISLKRFDLFIEVVERLQSRLPELKVVLCGKGPALDVLQSMIHKRSLYHTITLAGELPYEEVLKIMQRSKILLHPSSYEGFSGVCLEALYAGAHVISANIPMQQPMSHWHFATSVNEMTHTAYHLLVSTDRDHRSVLPYSVKEAAVQVMHLFLKD